MGKARIFFLTVVTTLTVLTAFQRVRSLPDHTKLSDTVSHPAPAPAWSQLYDSLQLDEKGLSKMAFKYAFQGFNQLDFESPVLAIADFSQSSRNKRLYIVDVVKQQLLLNTYVAHGRNSGLEFAEKFSNKNSSYQSSLGFFRTLNTYQGKHGLSLRLQGLEKGINDQAYTRGIVIHGADYVSEGFIRTTGRLGRSQGCPAVPVKEHARLIQVLKDGAGLFIFSKDSHYLKSSKVLASLEDMPTGTQTPLAFQGSDHPAIN